MRNNSKIKFLNVTLVVLILLQIILSIYSFANEGIEKDYYYISDMEYITENNWSYVGWGEIKKIKI